MARIPHYEGSGVRVDKLVVGPFENNVFVVRCTGTGEAVLIDAANEHDLLLEVCRETGVRRVLTTHGHWDHIQAVEALRDAGIDVGISGPDAEMLPAYDFVIPDGEEYSVGDLRLRAILNPGHTAGSTSFELVGHPVVFSGDTLFPGGPGNTSTPGASFEQILESIDRRLFTLPPETLVLPGHGLDTTIDTERPHLDEWAERGVVDGVDRFMIVGIGRSGSTHLEHLLDSHPDITCYGELFTPGHKHFDVAETADHHAYLDHLLAGAGTRVVGFKHMWPGLYAYPQTLDLLRDPTIRIIRLKRWNLLALHVSTLFVGSSGVGHSTQGRYKVDRVRVDLDRCFADIQNCYFVDLVLDELARDSAVAHVTYEHLIDPAHNEQLLAQLQQFLGVEPKALTSPDEQMRRRPLADSIENWDEVQAGLRQTPWEHFLRSE